jgi:hypothetical protein
MRIEIPNITNSLSHPLFFDKQSQSWLL